MSNVYKYLGSGRFEHFGATTAVIYAKLILSDKRGIIVGENFVFNPRMSDALFLPNELVAVYVEELQVSEQETQDPDRLCSDSFCGIGTGAERESKELHSESSDSDGGDAQAVRKSSRKPNSSKSRTAIFEPVNS